VHASAKQHALNPESISPELALVDPVLREQVRSASTAQRQCAPAVTADALQPITVAAPPPATARTWQRPSKPNLLAVVVLATVAAISMLTLLRHEHASTQRSKPPPDGYAERPASVVVPQRQLTRHANLTVSPHRPVKWAPVPYAAFYDVVLIRGKSRVLDLWPRKAQLSLATLSRRVPTGTYNWFVYPGFGQRHSRTSGNTFYGKLAAQGVLTIPQRDRRRRLNRRRPLR
jgi:hypothetical protein